MNLNKCQSPSSRCQQQLPGKHHPGMLSGLHKPCTSAQRGLPVQGSTFEFELVQDSGAVPTTGRGLPSVSFEYAMHPLNPPSPRPPAPLFLFL